MGEAQGDAQLYTLAILGVLGGVLLTVILPKPWARRETRWLPLAFWIVAVAFWTTLVFLYALFDGWYARTSAPPLVLAGLALSAYGLAWPSARVRRGVLAQLLFVQGAFLLGFAVSDLVVLRT